VFRRRVVGVRYDVSQIEYRALTTKEDGRDAIAFVIADPAAKPFTEKDVVESLQASGKMDGLLGLGSFDTRTVYEMVFRNKEDQRAFTQQKEITIKGHQAVIYNPDGRTVKGRLHWLSLLVQKEDVRAALEKFGKLLQLERQKIECRGGPLYSNTLEFELELNDGVKMDDIPAKLRVGTWTALVLVQGQPVMCFRCHKRGHIRAKCTATKEQEHDEDEAEESNGVSDYEGRSCDEMDTSVAKPKLKNTRNSKRRMRVKRKREAEKSDSCQIEPKDAKKTCDEQTEKMEVEQVAQPSSEVEEDSNKKSSMESHAAQREEEIPSEKMVVPHTEESLPNSAQEQMPGLGIQEETQKKEEISASPTKEMPTEKVQEVQAVQVEEISTQPPAEQPTVQTAHDNKQEKPEEGPKETTGDKPVARKQSTDTKKKPEPRMGRFRTQAPEFFKDIQHRYSQAKAWLDLNDGFTIACHDGTGDITANASVEVWTEILRYTGFIEQPDGEYAVIANSLATATNKRQIVFKQLFFADFFDRDCRIYNRMMDFVQEVEAAALLREPS